MYNILGGGVGYNTNSSQRISELYKRLKFSTKTQIAKYSTLNKILNENVAIDIGEYDGIEVFMKLEGYGHSSTTVVSKENIHLYERFNNIYVNQNSYAYFYDIFMDSDYLSGSIQLCNDYLNDLTPVGGNITVYGLKY